MDGLLPGGTILADTNDDIEAVVTEVKALAVTLRAVADKGECVVLEVVLYKRKSAHLQIGLDHISIDLQEAFLSASHHALEVKL